MVNDEKIKKIASILIEWSIDNDEEYIIDNLSLISNELLDSVNDMPNITILCRDISNYLTHIVNESNGYLQEIQIHLLGLALQEIINNRKDDSNASTQC